VAAAHPAIVCSISGFGQTGPRRDEPGYDAVMQAEGGLMSITGAADGPPFRLGVAISDVVTGMFAFQGIAMALLARRERAAASSRGRGHAGRDGGAPDLSVRQLFRTGAAPQRWGTGTRRSSRTRRSLPATGLRPGGRQRHAVAGFLPRVRTRCARRRPRFVTNRQRVLGYAEIRPLIAEQLRTRTRAEWIAALTGAGVPCGAVRDVGEVIADPQLAARAMVEAVEHATLGPVRVLGVPVKLSDTPGSVRTAPPTLGQHTDAILTGDLGFTPDDVARMRADGAI
jgi:formyl-CoA transferase/CoA:oxalate CoA-transferase